MEKEKKKSKFASNILFIIAFILIMVSSFFIFTANEKKLLQSIEFDVEFEVSESNKTGVDVNNSVLKFGRTSPGGPNINRLVNINNQHPFEIRADSFISGKIAKVLELNSSYFVEPNNNITIRIKLNVPSDFALGNYTGKIRFDLYKEK